MRSQRTTSLSVTLVVAASLLGSTSLAQVTAPVSAEPRASAGNPSLLPNAPSVPRSPAASPASVNTGLPLEQQPRPEATVTVAPVHVIQDVGHTVVSPIYLRTNDLKWVLPLGGAASAAFATDTHTMTKVVSTNPSFNQTAINVSNGLV